MKKTFEIGEWIECEDGLGQVIFVRNRYHEKFEEALNGEKLEEEKIAITICKIFCGFDGKVKSRNIIKSYLVKHCDPISNNHLNVVNKVKTKESEKYEKYILYDDVFDISNVVTLRYKVTEEKKEIIKNFVSEIRSNLLPVFTFNDFEKEFKKLNLEMKLTDFVKYKEEFNSDQIVKIIFNNRMYKTKKKKKLFDWVKAV